MNENNLGHLARYRKSSPGRTVLRLLLCLGLTNVPWEGLEILELNLAKIPPQMIIRELACWCLDECEMASDQLSMPWLQKHERPGDGRELVH